MGFMDTQMIFNIVIAVLLAIVVILLFVSISKSGIGKIAEILKRSKDEQRDNESRQQESFTR